MLMLFFLLGRSHSASPREAIMILDELRLALRASAAHLRHRRAHEQQSLLWLAAELLRRRALAVWDGIASTPTDHHRDLERLAHAG